MNSCLVSCILLDLYFISTCRVPTIGRDKSVATTNSGLLISSLLGFLSILGLLAGGFGIYPGSSLKKIPPIHPHS